MPGSHGPRQSGSVIVPTEVPTHTSTISFVSHLKRFAEGALVLFLSSLNNTEDDSPLDNSKPIVDVEDETVPEDPAAVDVPDANAFSKLDGGIIDCSCDFNTLLVELLLFPLELEIVLLVLRLLLLPLPQLLLPLDGLVCCGFDNCGLFAAAAVVILMVSFEDGGPGAFAILLLLLKEELVLEFEENKLFVVLVLELFWFDNRCIGVVVC